MCYNWTHHSVHRQQQNVWSIDRKTPVNTFDDFHVLKGWQMQYALTKMGKRTHTMIGSLQKRARRHTRARPPHAHARKCQECIGLLSILMRLWFVTIDGHISRCSWQYHFNAIDFRSQNDLAS
jgi:hypothetical protein